MLNRRKYCSVCESFNGTLVEHLRAARRLLFRIFCEPKLVHLCTRWLKNEPTSVCGRFSFLISPDRPIPRSLAARVWFLWFDSRADIWRFASFPFRVFSHSFARYELRPWAKRDDGLETTLYGFPSHDDHSSAVACGIGYEEGVQNTPFL